MKKILQGREKFPASPNVEYKNIDLITELKIAFFCFNCSIVLETKDVYSKVWTFYNLTPLQKGFQKHYKGFSNLDFNRPTVVYITLQR